MEQGAEEGAFATFFRRNFASVAASPSLALGSPELGEDAAAEAFARAYARWPTVRAYDSPVGWTYRVGLNHGLRTAKRRGREAVLLGRGGHRAPAAEPPIDVDFWALLRELPDRELPVRLLMPLLERPMALVLVPPRRLVLMPVLREVPDVDQPNRLLRIASMLAACALRRR